MRPSTSRLPSSSRIVSIAALLLLVVAGCTPAPVDEPSAELDVDVIRPITLTDNARMPESDSGLMDVEIEQDRLVFLYSTPPERPLVVGDVVSGIKHGGYLRRVTEIVSSTATRVEVRTAPAELVEFIVDGHFRAQFHSRRDSSYQLEEGVGVATGALQDGVPLLIPGVDYGTLCGTEAGIDVTPIFEADLDTDIDIDIGGLRGLLRGQLESARFIVDGELELGATIVTSGTRTLECRWDISSVLAGRVPSWKWTTAFTVGPIPIVINHAIEPGLGVSLRGDLYSGTTTSTYSGRVALRAGIQYTRDGGWDGIWEPEVEGTAGVTSRDPGQFALNASIMAAVGYTAKIYDTVGAGFSIGPTLHGDFTVGSDRCTWNAEARLGIDLNVSVPVTVPVFDITLAAYATRRTLAETTIAMGNGTLPWCGGDAGASDPCRDVGSTCDTCNGHAGCGFCGATSQCMSDSRRAECEASTWRDSRSECIDCARHSDCASCVGDAFCGWCASSSACLNAPSGGGAPVSCTAWNPNDLAACGG